MRLAPLLDERIDVTRVRQPTRHRRGRPRRARTRRAERARAARRRALRGRRAAGSGSPGNPPSGSAPCAAYRVGVGIYCRASRSPWTSRAHNPRPGSRSSRRCWSPASIVYRPSFAGGPISDDIAYLMNPWVTQLQLATLPELLDPRSQATLSLNNYAPLRPLLHGAQWSLFYDETNISGANLAYHATNVVAHVVASRAARPAAGAGRAALRRRCGGRGLLRAAPGERRGRGVDLRAVDLRRARVRDRRAARAAAPARARASSSSPSRC